ncbi:hypothetical protein ACIQUC_13055 [Curtobacterium sp. NPDC098951]|uniref:hypothetical protein n=1 Tax=Curtobacterium sp. NPDC098951 TaxID=3363974 RepID=UPI0037FB7203
MLLTVVVQPEGWVIEARTGGVVLEHGVSDAGDVALIERDLEALVILDTRW